MATEGFADFEGGQTWYRIYGELPAPPNGPAAAGPGSTAPAARDAIAPGSTAPQRATP
jgi:hypothetical protein